MVVPPLRKPLSIESGFFGESSPVLERRVTRLLSLTDQAEGGALVLPRSWLRSAALLSVLFAFTLFGVFAISPLSIHRLIEALLHSL